MTLLGIAVAYLVGGITYWIANGGWTGSERMRRAMGWSPAYQLGMDALQIVMWPVFAFGGIEK